CFSRPATRRASPPTAAPPSAAGCRWSGDARPARTAGRGPHRHPAARRAGSAGRGGARGAGVGAPARALRGAQDRDARRAPLGGILAQTPAHVAALSARGRARLGLGRPADALQDFTSAHQISPSLALPVYGLAEANRKLGQRDKAAALYQQCADSSAPDASL